MNVQNQRYEKIYHKYLTGSFFHKSFFTNMFNYSIFFGNDRFFPCSLHKPKIAYDGSKNIGNGKCIPQSVDS